MVLVLVVVVADDQTCDVGLFVTVACLCCYRVKNGKLQTSTSD